MGLLTRSPPLVPPAFSRYSDGAIWSAAKATFDGIATSGLHNVNFTVDASTASILAIWPL
jgi:hypothetical protein